MKIEAIHSFVVLAREKSMSRCAEKIHISQQGLSRQIRALEKELGAELFIHSSKGVELSPEGEILYKRFAKVWSNYDLGLRELESYQKSRKEPLRLCVCPGIKQGLGLDFFMEFEHRHPEIDLRLEFLSDLDCEEALLHGRADGAFLDWPEHAEEYDNPLVIHSPLVAVMHRTYPLAGRESIGIRELAGQTVYIPDQSHRMSVRFQEHWPDVYASLRIRSVFNDYESFYRDLPRANKSVALTFAFLCQYLDPQLVVVPVQEKSFVHICFCLPKDQEKSAAMRAFLTYLEAWLKEHPVKENPEGREVGKNTDA